MPDSITLEISHPNIATGRIEGFTSVWARYVKGFDARFHCERCLKGKPVTDFASSIAQGLRAIEFDRIEEYDYLYLCGVGVGPREELWAKNFHAPLRFEQRAVAQWRTYNGYTFRALNAVILPIPMPKPDARWTEAQLRCKNFQFAVGYYGPPPRAGAARPQ